MVKPSRGGSRACKGDGQEGALNRVVRGRVWATQQCLLPTVCSWGWFYHLWREHLYPRLVVLKLEHASESSGGFNKTQVVGSHCQRFRFGWSGVGPKICTSDKLLGEMDVAGPGARLRTTAQAFGRSARRSSVPPNQQERRNRLGNSGKEPRMQLPADRLSLSSCCPSQLIIPDSSSSYWLQLCQGHNHLLFITICNFATSGNITHFPFYF